MKLFNAAMSIIWVITGLTYVLGEHRDFARAAYCLGFAVWMKLPFDFERNK